jgi:hypothetical protein
MTNFTTGLPGTVNLLKQNELNSIQFNFDIIISTVFSLSPKVHVSKAAALRLRQNCEAPT